MAVRMATEGAMVRLYSLIAAGLVAATLGALGFMVWQGGGDDRFAQCRGSVVAGGAGALGGPFELVDHTGRVVTDQTLVTMPTILYFGYTSCPDVCPLDAARNALAVEILEERGIVAQTVFVSFDPERDTPEVLELFSANHHPRMLGLTGTPEQIRAAARAYRVYFQARPRDDGFTLFDHSTHSYLLLPGHGFVEVLPRNLTEPQIVDRVECFVRRS
jgi:protein SCO1